MSRPRTLRCRRCRTPLVVARKRRLEPLVAPTKADARGAEFTCPTCGTVRVVADRAA